MKKIVLIVALLLGMMPVFAQKNTIVLGKTSGNAGVNSQWVTKLKGSILEGLTSTGRIDVVDGATLGGLSDVTSEAMAQLKEAGARYYLEATLETITTGTDSYDGKTMYKAKMEFVYQLYDTFTSTTLTNKKNIHYGSSSDEYDAAIADSFGLVDNDIVSMVNHVFRVSAEIKAVNETHPKKGIKSVYLGAGSSDGVTAGNIFEIFKVMDVAGELITEKIGEMKVVEVKSATLSLCNVTKGGKELQNALDNEIPIQVTSRPPKDILGGINDVLNSL